MRLARNFAGIGALGGLFLSAGCSSPVPPAAQAGVSIHVQEYDTADPAHTMDRCPPARHWVNVPYQTDKPPSSQTQQTDANESRMTAINNQNGNVVACSVKANGNGFQVTGDTTGYASSGTDVRKPAQVHIRIPKISAGESGASGTIAIQDDASLNPYQSTECTYSVSGGNLGIAAGSVWAQVQCENLKDPSSPGASCLVDTGFFLLENCAQ